MPSYFTHLEALRTALLADAQLAALVGTRVALAYPWDTTEPRFPRVVIYQEADNQAVSLPMTTDPARVRVDCLSQMDADEAAQMYERVYQVLHKKEHTLGILHEVLIKECAQTWAAFPMWDASLNAWNAPSRFRVRAMRLV